MRCRASCAGHFALANTLLHYARFRGQVQSAIRRFVFDYDTANADISTADVITLAEARARLAAYDGAAFMEGVARLLDDRHSTDHSTRVA
jgi:hypothetical protein